ncbi:MAG: class I SAM-dependent methyltransferase [Pseudomonadota bacterium]
MNDKFDNESVAAAFGATDNASLESHYQDWASSYDRENAKAGFRLPSLTPGFLSRYVAPSDLPILDAGCGTGLTGDNLKILGYRNIEGIDLSENMLDVAQQTGAYSRLQNMTLGDHLDFPDDYFAAVISTGVFTEGHAPSSSFDELVRVTASRGYLVFNVRDDIYEQGGFREKQDSIEAEGLWTLIEKSDRFRPFTVEEPNVIARIFVYQIC